MHLRSRNHPVARADDYLRAWDAALVSVHLNEPRYLAAPQVIWSGDEQALALRDRDAMPAGQRRSDKAAAVQARVQLSGIGPISGRRRRDRKWFPGSLPAQDVQAR
jgi:hypothetical protein